MAVPLTLADTAIHVPHVIESVLRPDDAAEWKNLLEEVGFLPGETVTVMARGVFGGDPIVVRVGNSTFALRLAEAACISVVPRATDAVVSEAGQHA